MTNLNRRITILLHIQKYCKEIAENLDFFGKNLETFERNNIFRDSISMKIFQIGELTKELNKADKEYVKQTKKYIAWQNIIKMRERFAHHYGEMDLNIIFNTAIEDIPVLSSFLDAEYTNLWDKYEVGNEEKLATGNNKAITISENEKLSQGELWDINKTDEKYIQARWNLTKENFENMQNYKGIGVNEMTNTFSFYTSHLYLKKNEATQQNESATRWGWLVNVSTAVSRASSTSTDENTAYSWNQDIVRIGHASIPFVYRGGTVNGTAPAGVLYTAGASGLAYSNAGFRPALSTP